MRYACARPMEVEGEVEVDGKENKNKVYRRSFVLTSNLELLKLINEGKFAEVRDPWHEELEALEEDRQLAIKTRNWGLYEEIWEKFRHALRMYDRYYVLADMKAKGMTLKREAGRFN